MDAARTALVPHEMNRGIVAPHDGVGFVAEVPRKPQHVTIERCCSRDLRNVEDRCALDKLLRVRRWWRGHGPLIPAGVLETPRRDRRPTGEMCAPAIR